MESIYIDLALYGSKNECVRTGTVFLPISEVCNGTVSLANRSIFFLWMAFLICVILVIFHCHKGQFYIGI